MTEPDDVHTITAGVGSFATSGDALVTLLRWVRPRTKQITILANLPALLGRDSEATTRLDTANVSRRHAVIELAAGELVVRDLESKNGVFLNGERIGASPLRPGDVLRLGDCCAVVEAVTADGLAGFGELAPGIFGGAAMRAVVKIAKHAASSPLNVLLQGETGTGKERFARALHGWSGRSGAFLAVNCAAYTESTALAELFGYRKGAFTGAERASPGHVRAAHRGTLLLDEVLDLSPDLQAKLLRVIEEREVMPLGETEPARVDVKFVAATQIPLAKAVASGRFRADLRARLEGIVVEIPPLRQRRADIVPLFDELLSRHGVSGQPELEPELVERLCLHDWPMNVRELENVARRLALLTTDNATIKLKDVADWLVSAGGALEPESAEAQGDRRAVPAYSSAELDALRAALDRHRGNLTKAAEELGITRPKAYRMLKSEKSGR
jgi:sigma-54 dependent transcriptional regulator, acetoin dehydrogenase operon transcriptional activator AcoR